MSLPSLQRLDDGTLRQEPTEEALSRQQTNEDLNRMIEKSDKENKADAAADLTAAGQPISEIGLLGARRILFGKYAGQTFKFLAENDLQYITYLLESDEYERDFDREDYPLWKADNKSSLRRYIELLPEYPEIRKFIEGRKEQRKLDLPTQEVLFGKYKGQKVYDILSDKDYCEWMMQQSGSRCQQFNEILYLYLQPQL